VPTENEREDHMAVEGSEAHETLSGLSAGNLEMLEKAVGLRELNRAGSGLDARTYSLVKLATLIALDAPPASYAWQVANALEEGATAEDFIGVLRAVAPQVGGPRVVAAAPEIMLAMGLAIEEEEGQ
jgi:alkylhydroperoxidase/carboxymuconolactone decarboxylase family protein YurZ